MRPVDFHAVESGLPGPDGRIGERSYRIAYLLTGNLAGHFAVGDGQWGRGNRRQSAQDGPGGTAAVVQLNGGFSPVAVNYFDQPAQSRQKIGIANAELVGKSLALLVYKSSLHDNK